MVTLRRALETYRCEGFSGVSRRGELLVLHRVARLMDTWIARLEQSSVVLPAKSGALLARNEIFRNCHHGERCFIIGNGPSLETQVLSSLAHELTFVVNDFWRHPIVEQWQPSYCFFADPVLFDGSEPRQRYFNHVASCIHSTTFFVPLYAKNTIRKMALLPLSQTYYVSFVGKLKNGLWGRPDFARIVPGVTSVSQFAIMAAMYMGCSPIYLLGMDHDWLAHQGRYGHFYEEGKTTENHPKADSDLSPVSYKSDLEGVLGLWRGYEFLLKVASSEGIRIVNATNGGYLDVFPREEYKSLFPCTDVR